MINKKMLKVVVIITIILFSSIVGVYAERIIASSKVTYSNSSSGLSSTNVQGAIDELYNIYEKYVPTFVSYLQSLASSDTIIADDGTADHNMRYTGKTPNNYVTFEGEEWRIIGLFNNVDNGEGIKESRVKIIKSESTMYRQWHSSASNVWKNSSLNAEFQTSLYASSRLIANTVWYLGDPGANYGFTAAQAYEKERGTTVAGGNDATWTGKVGLMYPSDYGFASSACKDGAKNLNNYNSSEIDCKGTDWLFQNAYEWFLSPNSSSTFEARGVHNGNISGAVTNIDITLVAVVRPVVYLKPNVTCKNCFDETAGTKSNPFQLALK